MNGNILRKLKTLLCHGKLYGAVIFTNLMSAERADSFHERCADDPATLSSQMQKAAGLVCLLLVAHVGDRIY